LSAAIARNCTSIYFESPHRLQKSLAELEVLAPAHAVCVARELTKQFETFHRGTAQELQETLFSDHPPRGEITLVVAPASKLGDQRQGRDWETAGWLKIPPKTIKSGCAGRQIPNQSSSLKRC